MAHVRQHWILLTTILCVAVMWLATSMLDAMVFRIFDFPQTFFPMDSPQILGFRGVAALIIAVAGLLIAAVSKKAARARRDLVESEMQYHESEARIEEAERLLTAGEDQYREQRNKIEACREALERVHEEFTAVAGGVFDWETWWDGKGVIRWISPAVQRMTGYTVEACLSMKDYPAALISPEDRQRVQGAIKRAASSEVAEEVRYLKQNAGTGWALLRCRPGLDAAGRPAGVRATFKDITDERTAREKMAAEHADVLSQLSDNAARKKQGGLQDMALFCLERLTDAVVMVDVDGALLYGNQAACGLLNCSKDEMQRMDVALLNLCQTPGQWPSTLQTLKQAGSLVMEAELARKNGGKLPVRITWHYLQNAAGEYGCAMIRDLSRRVHADALLKESEQRFQLLTDGSSFGMLVLQGKRLVYSNRASENMIGINAAGLAGMDFWSLVHPAYREHARARIAALAERADGADSLELVLLCRDGRERLIDAGFSPLFWNRAPSVLVAFNDITDRKVADKALQESELRYRRLVESVTDYIYTVRVQDGRVLETRHGPGCVAVTGYTSTEYDENPYLWVTMVPEIDRPAILEQANKILKGEDAQPVEHRLIHKDGRIIWVKNAPVPHYDERGRLTGYDGMVSNITERRLAEEGIIEHARTLELLNRVILAANHAEDLDALLREALDTALSLMRFDFGGVYILDAAGANAELVFSLRAPQALQHARKHVPADEGYYRKVLELGEAVFLDDYAASSPENAEAWGVVSLCSIPLISKHRVIGAITLACRHTHAFSESERDTLLAIGRQVGTAIEKIRSEEALRENEAKYRTITEHSLTGIFIIADGRLAFANEGFAKILGFPLRQMLAWNIDQFMERIHPEDKPFVADQNRRKMEAEAEAAADLQPVFDCRFVTAQGSVKWVLLHSRRIDFPGGQALAGVAVDITDRKLAEQAVAAANRQLRTREEQLRAVNEQLFGVIEQLKASERDLVDANAEKEILMKEIHHRVKNNLQVISSLLNLQSAHVSGDNAAALIKDCQGRIKSMALVHEQLCQARNLAEINIEEHIRALANHLFVMYGSVAAGIRLVISAAQVHLGLDRAIPCSLIINELLSNSLKYGFPDGRSGEISVSLDAAPNGSFRLVVADTGVGLPDGIDFRNSSTLGLQLVMTFVEQLSGRIELDRRAGTRFAIEFPGVQTGQAES